MTEGQGVMQTSNSFMRVQRLDYRGEKCNRDADILSTNASVLQEEKGNA